MDKSEVIKRLGRLTQREREVLSEFGKEIPYWKIGNNLGLTEGAIKTHMSNIFSKLELAGFKRDERRKALLEVYCPVLESENIETPPPEPPELESNPDIDDETIDELQYGIIKVEPAEIVGPPTPPGNRRRGCRTFIFGLLAGAILIALAGLGIYWMWMTFAPRLTGEPDLESPTAQVAEVTRLATVIHTQIVTEPVVAEDMPNPSATSENLPSPTTAAPTPTESPSIPLPFTDNFDNGPNPAWKALNGDWLTANGRYTILGEGYDFKWSILDEPSWENYRVSVNMEIANHRSGAQGIIAIAVRIQHNKPQYIGFYINSLTYGGWALLGTDRHDTEFIADYGPVIPETSNLVLEVNGNQFTAYLDGRVYQEINFPGYERGGVALGIGCNFSSCTSFDDFSVESIDP